MAVRPIRHYGDPVLRKKASPVRKIDSLILRILDDMADTMYSASGLGLAGPQVGITKRLVVVDIGEGLYKLINPRIQDASGTETGPEGCLSFPNVFGDVERFLKVVVKALDPKGKTIRIEAEGLLARAFQHELDHLDGKLFVDAAGDLREYIPDESQDADKKEKGQAVTVTLEELKEKYTSL
jgi:peptide deformylase